MHRSTHDEFRAVMAHSRLIRLAGVHSGLGGLLAEEAGFDAVWASSFEISASHGLPDASLLTMTDYLAAAEAIQKAVGIPVVADCDTGFGNALNVAYMVHEYEAAGITAICIEDKVFPKANSFAEANHSLVSIRDFSRKIHTAKAAQSTPQLYLIARTEALIHGLGTEEALRRCHAYVDAGADAVLVHSKAKSNFEVSEFLQAWSGRCPVVIVPTTYPDWHADDVHAAGASVVIYANQGLRTMVESVRQSFASIYEKGETAHLEQEIASVEDIFALQRLKKWQELEP